MVIILWYLILVLLIIPFKIKIINIYDKNQIKISFLFIRLTFDQDSIKKRFKENKMGLNQVLNYLSLSNFLGDLVRIAEIKMFKIIKYIEDNNFFQTYPIILYYLFTSLVDGWLKTNHKKYHYEKMLIANKERTDYDFLLLMRISIIQIIYCAFKNLKDITRFIKKERLINGS